jgi:PAS domain S-box-containing protein
MKGALRRPADQPVEAGFRQACDGPGSRDRVPRDLSAMSATDAAARLAAIVDSSHDAIVSKTVDGIITSWNRAAERMFGYTAKEAVGQSILLIIPADRHFEEGEVLAKIRRGERVESFDTVRRTKDGRLFDVSLTVSPIQDTNGRIIGASKIARDITERKRAEQEHNELLALTQAANRVKDEFIAMFSHELRNPLSAIASATQAIALAATLDQVGRPRAVIERQVVHLRRLVDDLLDAARVQIGKISLDRRPVNLAEAVQHAVGVLQGGGAPARHVITVDVEDVGVSADAVRLEQVILNLVTNAVKYTPAGRAIHVSVFEEGDEAVMAVRDEGAGIAPDVLPRIFDLFVQGETTLARTEGGLGIGLTLVRTLVQLHGGRVEVASDGPGRGSAFTVRLPRIDLESAGDTPPVSRTAPGRRILIVEDNDDSRTMMRLVLEHAGQEVYEAADGAAGIEMAGRVQPDLVFVDLGLPLVDGYEVARQIRRLPRPPQRLIALTGYGQDEDRQRSLEAGFDEHVVKPMDSSKLSAILEAPPR